MNLKEFSELLPKSSLVFEFDPTKKYIIFADPEQLDFESIEKLEPPINLDITIFLVYKLDDESIRAFLVEKINDKTL